MSKVKSNLIKLFSCLFAVCIGVAIFAMPTSNEVGANDTAVFEMAQGASIRLADFTNEDTGDNYTGLRFQTNVNEKWFEENSAERYVFGTLIFPTSKMSYFDTSKSPSQNASDDYELQADNILANLDLIRENHCYTASIVFDEDVIKAEVKKRYEANGKEFNDTVWAEIKPELMYNVSKADFTAVSYVLKNGKVTYLTPYSTSMQKVAARTLVSIKDGNTADENGTIKAAALSYVGSWDEKYYDGYASVVDKEVVVEGIENYQVSDDAIVVLGNENAIVQDGKITLAGEYTVSRTTQKLYIFEEGSLKVVNLLLVDNVLKTPEDVKNFFDATTWAEDANHFNEVTVLANDVDMSTVEGDYGVDGTFKGYFDGRGHVISNLTKNTTSNVRSIFGSLDKSTVIKNIAFDNFTSIGYDVNNSWFAHKLCGTVENIYVRFAPGSEMQQMFMYTSEGNLNNVIIEVPYDEELDVDAWVAANSNAWGRTYLARMVNFALTDNMNNVHVISQLPLLAYGEASTYKEPTFTNGTVSKWNSYFAYGENETEVWHDYTFFHTATDDATAPGLGLAEGAQNVEYTQVFDAKGYSLNQGVTRVWPGVKRYDTLEEMVANNPDSVSAFENTGMWKMDNGALVWAKGNIKDVEIISTVDYDASTSELKTTAWEGETVQKVTLNGAQLTAEENGGLVVEDGNFIGIRAKTSESDPLPGIAYVRNGQNRLVSCNIVIETAEKIIYINNVQYWSKIIYEKADLLEALNVDYTPVADTAGTEKGTHTYEGNIVKVINGNNKITTFNVGIYKLTTDIDMEKTGIEYASELGESSEGGGFNGYFNGMGYSIKNFAPTTAGLFNTINHYATPGSGISLGYAATIENLAFENVITANDKPVIACNMGQQATGGNHKLRNIYVNYSSESTGSCGILRFVGPDFNGLNNVYVINNNTHNMINLNDQYRFYERDGVTVDDGLYLNPVFNGTLYNGALFGNLYKSSNSANNQSNVYVVSKLPIAHYNATGFMYVYSVYRNGTTVIYKNNGYLGGKFTKGVDTGDTSYKTFGYAENETLGRIPVIYKIRDNIVTEFTENYATLSSGSSWRGIRYCPVCGESTLLGAEGDACTTITGEGEEAVACEGKLVAVPDAGSSIGFFGKAVAYEWTLHLPKTEGVQTWDANNGTLRFLGVYKYDTIEDMKGAECDFTSFTGEDGNGMWKVVENELTWVGAQA